MSEINVHIPKFTASRGWQWYCERRHLLNGTAPGLLRHTVSGFEIIGDSTLPPMALLGAVLQHRQNVDNDTLVKNDVKRRISRATVNGSDVIVKEYRHIRRLRCFSPDQLAWLGARRLHGICRVLAWLRAIDCSVAYLIMEDVGQRDMYLKGDYTTAPEATALFRAAGKLLGRLHQAGIYHADCKSSNFVVKTHSNAQYSLELIDCDDVRICHITNARRAKNFAQFLGLQGHITDFEQRLTLSREFTAGYVESSGLSNSAIGTILKQVCRYSNKIYPQQGEIMANLMKRLGDNFI